MHLSWLETAGRLSLGFYLIAAGGLMLAIVIRAAFGNPWRQSAARRADPVAVADRGSWTVRIRLSQFLLEYVGNLSVKDPQEYGLPADPTDRRSNRQGRVLLDWVREEMEARRLPARDQEQLLEDLRRAMRHGELQPIPVRREDF